ncbi:hypothetical protein C0J52_03369 [Blattella germanica]|nr:hypothetical protein C0J52_03369 [Blattella germanica]
MLLINDAIETKFWAERDLTEFEGQGITLAFLATHSGLTRWQGSQYNLETSEFKKTNIRAIEEVWYKQAVEFKDNFVYLAPFPDEVGNNNAEVTVSQAIFVEYLNKKIPVAVAGYRIKHWNLNLQFSSYTSECRRNELICYLVDTNGYIVASDVAGDTGKFLGELEGYAMTQFVLHGIFKRIPVLDYQAVCLQDDSDPSCATFITTPGRQLLQLFQYMIGMYIWLISQTSFWFSTLAIGAPINITPWEDLRINSSRPQSCVKQVDLYIYNIHNHSYPDSRYFKWIGCNEDKSKSLAIQKVPHSNLLLVVISAKCHRDLGMEYVIDNNIVSDTRACVTHNITRRAPRPCVGAIEKDPPSIQCSSSRGFEVSTLLLIVSWHIQAFISASDVYNLYFCY